ncbi:MAG: SemiSWEET family transporter [bacterium]|nr:SemiSWEET family transporter [bacterium]
MNLGMRHIHARKRVARSLEPFPSSRLGRRVFDYLMYGVGLLQPVALLPQVAAIYLDGSKSGVSLSTWLMLTVFNTLWATYGYLHHDRLIMTANILLTILDIAIVAGVLWY